MMPTVRQILLREISTGMSRLVGTRATAAIHVSETALRQALLHIQTLPPTLTVRILPENRIVVGYGAVHATAVLPAQMNLPRIDLELRSMVVAWALRAVAMPAVSVSGRRVTFDLGQLHGLRDFAQIWPHFRAVQVATADGTLVVHVDFAVT